MAKVNLNSIRTGNAAVDRTIGAAQAAISNPAAAPAIVGGLISGIARGDFNKPDATATETVVTPHTDDSRVAQRKLHPTNITYPSDLDDDHYMIFCALTKTREKLLSPAVINTTDTIALPIPTGLQVGYAADYENASLGLLGGLAAGTISASDVGDTVMSGIDELKKVGQQALDAMSGNDKGAGKTLGELPARVGGSAAAGGVGAQVGGFVGAALGAGAVSGEIGAGLSKRFGLAVNPHQAVVFKGIGFKEHSFNYKFVARNQEESDTIQAICRQFRDNMLPVYADAAKLAFKYPNEFQIVFSDAIAPYLFSIGHCVLKSFNVTYNGGGVPQFFSKTQAPIEVEISMSFQETQIETRNSSTDMVGSSASGGYMQMSGFGGGGRGAKANEYMG